MMLNQRVPLKEFTETASMKSGWEKTIKIIQTMSSKERFELVIKKILGWYSNIL